MKASLATRAGLLSLLIFVALMLLWQFAAQSGPAGPAVDPEYAKLIGAAAAGGGQSSVPTPLDVGAKLRDHFVLFVKQCDPSMQFWHQQQVFP